MATTAQLGLVYGVCMDRTGNLLIAAINRNIVFRLNLTTGVLSRVAGTGAAGYSGDGGPATSATLKSPADVHIDTLNNIYIADGSSCVVRKVDAVTGIISTIAGIVNMTGNTGDGGPATAAQVTPTGIFVKKNGDVYIAGGLLGHYIRKVDAATGIITTLAGTGISGFGGDGGPATAAQLNRPEKVILDDTGNIYISDRNNGRIRKVIAATGTIITIAGQGGGIGGAIGGAGDNDIADSAGIGPRGMAFDTCGNLIFADQSCRIRVLSKSLPYSPSCSTVGMPEAIETNTWKLYPNPATNTLTVKCTECLGAYTVHDLPGRTLLQGTLKKYETVIDIANLVPGLYIISTDGRRAVFVKQ